MDVGSPFPPLWEAPGLWALQVLFAWQELRGCRAAGADPLWTEQSFPLASKSFCSSGHCLCPLSAELASSEVTQTWAERVGASEQFPKLANEQAGSFAFFSRNGGSCPLAWT